MSIVKKEHTPDTSQKNINERYASLKNGCQKKKPEL